MHACFFFITSSYRPPRGDRLHSFILCYTSYWCLCSNSIFSFFLHNAECKHETMQPPYSLDHVRDLFIYFLMAVVSPGFFLITIAFQTM